MALGAIQIIRGILGGALFDLVELDTNSAIFLISLIRLGSRNYGFVGFVFTTLLKSKAE